MMLQVSHVNACMPIAILILFCVHAKCLKVIIRPVAGNSKVAGVDTVGTADQVIPIVKKSG